MNEVHGVRASKSTLATTILLRESADTVCVDLDGRSTAFITADEARYLARQLRRLARRLDFRAENGFEP